MIRSGKIKKVKSKLRAKMILNKDLFFDLKQIETQLERISLKLGWIIFLLFLILIFK